MRSSRSSRIRLRRRPASAARLNGQRQHGQAGIGQADGPALGRACRYRGDRTSLGAGRQGARRISTRSTITPRSRSSADAQDRPRAPGDRAQPHRHRVRAGRGGRGDLGGNRQGVGLHAGSDHDPAERDVADEGFDLGRRRRGGPAAVVHPEHERRASAGTPSRLRYDSARVQRYVPRWSRSLAWNRTTCRSSCSPMSSVRPSDAGDGGTNL